MDENKNLKKPTHWAVIIVLLIYVWPVGLFLLYKRLAFDETNGVKNARILRNVGIGITICGVVLDTGVLMLLILILSIASMFDAAASVVVFIIFLLCAIIPILITLVGVSLIKKSKNIKADEENTDNMVRKNITIKHTNKNNAENLSIVINCKNTVINYLHTNPSTDFFRKILTTIAQRLIVFDMSCNSFREVVVKHFESAGLSHNKFKKPVEELQGYICNLIDNLIYKMRVFNEEEYRQKIIESTDSNNLEEAEKYKAIECEYESYAKKALDALENAIIKVDKLILEISKLSEEDIDRAVLIIMNDLETTIKDASLYK